jgi:hypothetical protein
MALSNTIELLWHPFGLHGPVDSHVEEPSFHGQVRDEPIIAEQAL